MELKEFLESRGCDQSPVSGLWSNVDDFDIIEFAKYHVLKALKYAMKNAITKDETVYTGGIEDRILYEKVQVVDEDSILYSYNLNDIK